MMYSVDPLNNIRKKYTPLFAASYSEALKDQPALENYKNEDVCRKNVKYCAFC